MKIVFTGGGTAGHIYPAIAMAEEIVKKYPKAELLFIGRSGGDENAAIIKAKYPLSTIEIEGLKRGFDLRNFGIIFKAFQASRKAKTILRDFLPDIVIGTGGYVTFPVILAATELGVPTLIHESNAIPGLVTRMLSKRVDAVMLGFQECEEHLPQGANCIFTGNPVRYGFRALTRDSARRRLKIPPHAFVIVSFGGSLGAEALNKAIIPTMLKEISSRDIIHIHATGRRYYKEISKINPTLARKSGTRIVPYIENMPELLSAADLAITRSGAITTAELTELALPSILIPSPNVTGDHQTKNARAIESLGGGIVIPQSELSGEKLFKIIGDLKVDKAGLKSMSDALKKQNSDKIKKTPLSVIESFL